MLFSDIDGVYTKNPKDNPDAKRIDVVDDIKQLYSEISIGSTNAFGTGGMGTKLEAAERVVAYGIPMILADGGREKALEGLAEGKYSGTLFIAE